MHRIWRTTASIFATLLVISGCNKVVTDPSTSLDRWGGLLSELRVRWSAPEGIDLLNGPAVPLRAYLESRLLAENTGNLEYAYPGFGRAVHPNEAPESANIGGRDRIPTLDYPAITPLIGTSRYHIQSVQSSGHTFTISVCNYVYAVAKQQADGSLRTLIDFGPIESRGVIGMRVTLTAPQEESAPALPPQSGSDPAPSDDVFGGWRVDGFLAATTSYVAAQWPTFESDRDACIRDAPDSAQHRTFLVTDAHDRVDFPTDAPSPGWPAKPSAATN
ncbi:hypothetical protein [Mycolicibacterium septicum]|uniref:hypothetical protein n=1 Tax=Mycolicibacterium septicum TaxID=98668 RepID=UPI001AF59F45|nr:hypothetical protein [Mycolicibacterium septicum]QRY52216.1 hypothetical protein JVX95_02105 [Mycolicibacterium septicum]